MSLLVVFSPLRLGYLFPFGAFIDSPRTAWVIQLRQRVRLYYSYQYRPKQFNIQYYVSYRFSFILLFAISSYCSMASYHTHLRIIIFCLKKRSLIHRTNAFPIQDPAMNS